MALLVKRSKMRTEPAKKEKDLVDARNYLLMLESHINEAQGIDTITAT